MENRRIVMKDGSVVDVRHAYSMPAEEDVAGVGPSLIGINERAGSRVEGEGPLTYMYNSIYNSQAYLVPEFADQAQHMPIYGETGELTDQQIYNLIAYLQTLPSE